MVVGSLGQQNGPPSQRAPALQGLYELQLYELYALLALFKPV